MEQNKEKTPMSTAEKYCFYVTTLCFIFFGYIVVMSYNTHFSLPQETAMIMTAVISIATATSGYIIGSNSSSKRKDDLISKAMDTVPMSAMPGNSITSSVLTLKWLGSFDAAPQNPMVNDAYVDTKQNKNFYWNGSEWIITTQTTA